MFSHLQSVDNNSIYFIDFLCELKYRMCAKCLATDLAYSKYVTIIIGGFAYG